VRAALPEAARGQPLEIWFQDEARVGQQGTLTRLWARRGTRPRAPKDCRYAWAYLFGAICPARATGAALVMPYANTEAMNLHLAEIAKAVSPGAHALLVLDGAGWHSTKELTVPPNITLLPLPPYSPELNPVENIWQFLRQNHLANRLFDSYEAIVDACCEAWNALLASPERITSITSRDWTQVRL
jgi:transposase